MEGVAKEKNLDVNRLRLMIDGQTLMRDRTVAQVHNSNSTFFLSSTSQSELKDGDELQLVVEQIGGDGV